MVEQTGRLTIRSPVPSGVHRVRSVRFGLASAPIPVAIAGREEHRRLALEVLFAVLDFAGCTKNLTAWRYLAKYLRETLLG